MTSVPFTRDTARASPMEATNPAAIVVAIASAIIP